MQRKIEKRKGANEDEFLKNGEKVAYEGI